MKITCTQCSSCKDECSFSRYEDWVQHLLGEDHQDKMRAELMNSVRFEDQEGWVITFSKTEDGGAPSKMQIFQFFAARGFMGQFYFDEQSRFCFLRVDSVYEGLKPIEQGSYYLKIGQRLHRLNCLKAKETTDAYWLCLIRRAFEDLPLRKMAIQMLQAHEGKMRPECINMAGVHQFAGGDYLSSSDPRAGTPTKTTVSMLQYQQFVGTNPTDTAPTHLEGTYPEQLKLKPATPSRPPIPMLVQSNHPRTFNQFSGLPNYLQHKSQIETNGVPECNNNIFWSPTSHLNVNSDRRNSCDLQGLTIPPSPPPLISPSPYQQVAPCLSSRYTPLVPLPPPSFSSQESDDWKTIRRARNGQDSSELMTSSKSQDFASVPTNWNGCHSPPSPTLPLPSRRS